jgi:hypothetical protein
MYHKDRQSYMTARRVRGDGAGFILAIIFLTIFPTPALLLLFPAPCLTPSFPPAARRYSVTP